MSPVSVVIAVYNGQDMVGQAISSVLHQTHPSIEVFVVDDGSTDHTPEVLGGYEALDRPGRDVRVLRQENAGCGAARNRALEHVSGDCVTVLDADDELLPHHLETAARMMPSQRRVALKSRIARVPGGMRWLVRRQRAVDRSVGYTDAMRR
ncbi:MAG TPA: hypothetical protein DCL70_04485 [Kocuria sp.]|nr:hypothetical protein [Kocuria sp.]